MKFISRLIVTIIVFIIGFLSGGVYFADKDTVFDKSKSVLLKGNEQVSVDKDITIDSTQVREIIGSDYTKTVKEVVKQDGNHIFTVQVASLKDLEQAKGFVAKLIKQDYDAYIAPNDLSANNNWYRICIGEYLSKDQADIQHQKLKAQFQDSFVQKF